MRLFLLNLFADAPEPCAPSDVVRLSTGDNLIPLYRHVDGGDPASWSFAHVARLRLKVQRHLAARRPDSMLVKTHAALMPMAGEPPFAMDVAGGAICVVRNPLDIAPSYARHLGATVDATVAVMAEAGYTLPRTAELAEFIQGSWSQNVASWTARPNPLVHVMRYEDMVADPRTTFARVRDFLKLDPSPERLDRAIRHSALDTLMRLEDERGFIERVAGQKRFFGEGGVDVWKEALTEAQARRIVAQHRVQMARFGYVPEGW